MEKSKLIWGKAGKNEEFQVVHIIFVDIGYRKDDSRIRDSNSKDLNIVCYITIGSYSGDIKNGSGIAALHSS